MLDLRHGDCTEILKTLPSASVDAVITDPPYPEIDRSYGRMTENEWFEMMRVVVPECMRVLKPMGSAVFILQPNSERVGKMRMWLWEFMVWVGKEWGIVQDVWWWNTTARPVGVSQWGLTRPSLKACVWIGAENCYRHQKAVLWTESQRNLQKRTENRAYNYKAVTHPSRSGGPDIYIRMAQAAAKNGGVTPFNVLPIPNSNSTDSAGSNGHGAGTPFELADWWTRYICPPMGVVCDPFMGSGTMGITALQHGGSFIGIEKMEQYYNNACGRIRKVEYEMSLPQAQSIFDIGGQPDTDGSDDSNSNDVVVAQSIFDI
jgi:DNA modification methylase